MPDVQPIAWGRPLAGCRILFFCSSFFGYERSIVEALVDLGAEVVFRCDRPYETPWFKSVLRLLPRVGQAIADLAHSRWLATLDQRAFDIVFVLKGEGLSNGLLADLHRRYPRAEFVLYLWDSLCNVPAVEKNLAVFDRIYSFDREDCARFPGFCYRALFFADRYWNPEPRPGTGVFFLGTLNGDRPKVLAGVGPAVQSSGGILDYWLFVRSGVELRLRWLFDPSLRRLDPSRLLRTSLPADEVAGRFASSAAILDIQHPDQTGLTMRTFEVLAAGKKLITTNPKVREEDFFAPDLICVIDRNAPSIPAGFIDSPTPGIGEGFQRKYAIRGWAVEILCRPV
jgi:hypothetical protein